MPTRTNAALRKVAGCGDRSLLPPPHRVHVDGRQCEKHAACLVKDARANAGQRDQFVPDLAAQPGEVW